MFFVSSDVKKNVSKSAITATEFTAEDQYLSKCS